MVRGDIYKTREGVEVWIGGDSTRSKYAYSVQGNWYDKETGRFIHSNRDGTYSPAPEHSYLNLNMELGVQGKWL